MSDLWVSIEDISQLTTLLGNTLQPQGGSILIFKHSSRCAISSMAKRRLESKLNPLISYHIVDVIRNRPVSIELSELTGVQHESPQAFLFHKGQLLGHWSHSGIRPEVIGDEIANN